MKVRELADAMVETIVRAGELTTGALRQSVGGHREDQTLAMKVLEAESPPRVVVGDGKVPSGQRARVWTPAGPPTSAEALANVISAFPGAEVV